MLVFADEFRFSPSRRTVPAGVLRLQLKNIGEDDHDLRVLGPSGGLRGQTARLHPGGLGEIRARLPRGRYSYLCTVGDHAARGMKGTFTVIAPKKRA
jgi:uncharacterized cupredoxin-like copper-binding protein